MGYLDHIAILRKRNGLTQARLAELMNVEQPTIQRWETGKREPTLAQLIKLAEVLQVEPGALIDSSIATALGPRLFVKGDVAAGVWREATELPHDEWQSFTGRADITAPLDYRFGLRVVGDSMNEIYPEGTILECVSVRGHAEPAPGKRVVVVRKRSDQMYEATVKELVRQDGELWLVPRSSNPEHIPIKLFQPDNDIDDVHISAVVVASVRPE